MYHVIGYYELKERTVMRRHYETASWYTDVAVEPGVYPVEISEDLRWSQYGFIRFHGIVDASFFVSRLGASYGAPEIDEDKGERQDITAQRYMYQIVKDPAFKPVERWKRGEEFAIGARVQFCPGGIVYEVEEETEHFLKAVSVMERKRRGPQAGEWAPTTYELVRNVPKENGGAFLAVMD